MKAQQEYINLKNAIRQVKQNLEKEKSQLQEKMSQKQAIDDGATKLASMDS